MKPEEVTKDYAGLVAIKLGGASVDQSTLQGAVSAGLLPFASEPLQWEGSGKAVARLRREGVDQTTSMRVLAIEQTIGAAAAIRALLAGVGGAAALACDVEPIDADPSTPEYWVRRQRLDRLVQSGAETLCRRELVAARPRTLERLRVHLESTDQGSLLRLVSGSPTALTCDVGRWVTPFVEVLPETWGRNGFLDKASVHDRQDVARVASPDASTRVVLVLAEAWAGKSYVAQQIRKALRDRRIEVRFTSFETNAPDWPEDEFLSQSRSRVWIVDAIDEAERRGTNIEKLGRSLSANGLTTLVFGRPDATLADVDLALGFSPGRVRCDNVERLKLRLLPLDRDQARREFAEIDDAHFEELLDAAKSTGAALTFEELKELERSLPANSIPNLGEIRRGIARHRCTRLRGGAGPIAIGGGDMFKAAEMLAAVAALCNERRFHFGELAPGFAVNDVLPVELRAAAHALRETTALARVGKSSCFAAAHLEEDLASGFLVDALTKSAMPLKVHALRTLLTDGRQPRPELERVIQRVAESLNNHPSQRIFEAALRPFEPGEAMLRFQMMVAEARKSESPLWAVEHQQLKWFNANGVRVAVNVLLEGKESEPVLHLALRVALANNWRSLARPAVELALSETVTSPVRQLAVLLAAKDPEHLERLRVLLDRIARDEPDEELAEVRAAVVLELLQSERLSVLDAARLCSPGSVYRSDFRARAIAELERRLDGGASRAILDELRGFVSPRSIDVGVCTDLRNGVAAAFFASPVDVSSTEDVDRVVYIVGAERVFDVGFEELRGSLEDSVRRAVYRRMDAKGESSLLFSVEKDAAWLVECADTFGSLPNNVCADLIASILFLDIHDQSYAAERGRELLRQKGLWDRFEARLVSARDWETKQREWALARDKHVEEVRKNALPIEQVIDTFLGDRRDASLRLHVLGDFFFGDRQNGHNVVGTFDDLSEHNQKNIMEATRGTLVQATPLPIPDGNTFSSFLFDEGQAFIAAALWRRDWLDRDLVTRWLPAALVVATDPNSRAEEIIDRCFTIAPKETRKAVIGDILRRARQGYARTDRLPAVLWADDGFRSDLIALTLHLRFDNERERTALPDLLDDLCDAHDDPKAPPNVRSLLDNLVENPDGTVARKAVGAWFRRWPVESVGLAIASADTMENAAEVFAAYHRMGMRQRQRELPPRIAVDLVHHLLPLVPVTPPQTGRFRGRMDDRDSLAEWRDRLVRLCIEHRAEKEFSEAIEAIRQHQLYGLWLRNSEIRQRMETAVAAPERPWPTPDEVARILRESLAILHEDSDLALLVAEILRTPWDPSLTTLVYEGQKHVPEAKLQVLIRDKLIEGLKIARPPIEATPIREPNERGTDEPDFVVMTTNHVPLLEVPIEVKWSDNDPAGGLEHQLGDRYLGGAGRTHGVFVVAWTGTPSSAYLDAILEKARLRQGNQGRTIHVVRKDLLPRATMTSRSNRAGRATSRSAPKAAPGLKTTTKESKARAPRGTRR